MAYSEWCPKCKGPIISVTRGIPSIARCATGHESDRRDVLRREPVSEEKDATIARLTAANAALKGSLVVLDEGYKRIETERDAAQAALASDPALWLGKALQAVASLPTGSSEDMMEGHEQAYRAIEAISPTDATEALNKIRADAVRDAAAVFAQSYSSDKNANGVSFMVGKHHNALADRIEKGEA